MVRGHDNQRVRVLCSVVCELYCFIKLESFCHRSVRIVRMVSLVYPPTLDEEEEPVRVSTQNLQCCRRHLSQRGVVLLQLLVRIFDPLGSKEAQQVINLINKSTWFTDPHSLKVQLMHL